MLKDTKPTGSWRNAVSAATIAVVSLVDIAWPRAAHAGGSVQLDDVMPVFARSARLAAEVQAELSSQQRTPAQVVCTAVRLGRQWEALGGTRIGPYECDFGTRRLTVGTKRTFFDVRGIAIGSRDADVNKRATNVVETEPSWDWQTIK